MAEEIPVHSPHPFDSTALEIEHTFNTLIDLLSLRKLTLLLTLSRYRAELDAAERNNARTEEELRQMGRNIQNTKANELTSLQDRFLGEIEAKLANLRSASSSFKVRFDCDTNDLKKKLENLGDIVKICNKATTDYSLKKFPITAVAKQGDKIGELNEPRCITFEEETQFIFVTDRLNNRIQIFQMSGQFFSEFGREVLIKPWGIALNREYIFVSNIGDCTIRKFKRCDFQLLGTTGREGDMAGEFNCPRQLAVGPDRGLYVTEDLNNRISVLDLDLNFHRIIQHEMFDNPMDVKFTTESMLVLNIGGSDLISVLDLNGNYIGKIPRGQGVGYTCCFALEYCHQSVPEPQYPGDRPVRSAAVLHWEHGTGQGGANLPHGGSYQSEREGYSS